MVFISQLIHSAVGAGVLINGATVSRVASREQPGWERRMKADDRAWIAVRFDRERLDESAVALFDLNALGTLDAVDEMAGARGRFCRS